MRLRAVALFVALFSLAGTGAVTASAADVEGNVLVCTGTVASGTLSIESGGSPDNYLSCTRVSFGVSGGVGAPEPWYSGSATSSYSNAVLAPFVVASNGALYFTVGSESWVMTYFDYTVDNVMPFAHGDYDDLVSPGRRLADVPQGTARISGSRAVMLYDLPV